LGKRDGVTSVEHDRIKALAREVKESRRANEMLKLARALPAGLGESAIHGGTPEPALGVGLHSTRRG